MSDAHNDKVVNLLMETFAPHIDDILTHAIKTALEGMFLHLCFYIKSVNVKT